MTSQCSSLNNSDCKSEVNLTKTPESSGPSSLNSEPKYGHSKIASKINGRAAGACDSSTRQSEKNFRPPVLSPKPNPDVVKRGTVLVITVGTGLGTSMFTDGKLIPNFELGHLKMYGDCAEKYASNLARKKLNLSYITKLLEHEKPQSALYIVPTPIGNLSDITIRSLKILSSVDLIMSEDTRVTKKITSKYGIKCKMQSFHKFNSKNKIPGIIKSSWYGRNYDNSRSNWRYVYKNKKWTNEKSKFCKYTCFKI